MVSIEYFCQLGNNLFQYTFARMIAQKNNLCLATPWKYPQIINFSNPPDGKNNKGKQIIKITDRNSLEMFSKDLSQNEVIINGLFQQHIFYDDQKQEILSWIKESKIHPVDAIGVHFRFGDYISNNCAPVIDLTWYEKILNLHENKNRKIVVVVERSNKLWEKEYIKSFQDIINCTVISGNVCNDFNTLRSFENVIMSNSTFAWWASYLGNAKRIYTFKRWLIDWPSIDLSLAKGMIPVDGKYIWERK